MAVEQTLAVVAGSATAGAILGSVVKGAVDFRLDRIRERRDAEIGARLVRLDLSHAASQLQMAEAEQGKWWVFYNTEMSGWHAHKTSLAAHLTRTEFETVTQSVGELLRFGADMRQAPLKPGATYREVPVQPIRKMREDASAAYSALARLAKHPTSDGLLHG